MSDQAIACLQLAAQQESTDGEFRVEERAIWQPDSWLIQRCWQALADGAGGPGDHAGGAGEAALSVAALLEARAPIARAQALYRIARRVPDHPELAGLVRRELQQGRLRLFDPWTPGDEKRQIDRLLLAGASAARVGDPALAFACLERIDQAPHAWDRVLVTEELRSLLAETVAQIGLHPLTASLVTSAIRRFEEAGAFFLQHILAQIGPRVNREELPRRTARLMQRCVETFQYATLTTLNSRRLAASAFGQAGLAHDVLAQLTTIGHVQAARRDSGLSSTKGDPHFLRQVKRPSANLDIDFQVYTLQEAIRMAPVRTLTREQRIALSDQLAGLAVKSDGWTAAGAAASLIELGALKYAIDVVDHIPAQDPTRSEGVVSLVRALLELGDLGLAEEQVRKALTWLKSLDRRNPERATIWGLAEVYLEHGNPEMALHLLDQRYNAPATWSDRMRRAFRNRLTDDQLRDNRLRFRALLARGDGWTQEVQELYDQLRQWAPRLLDGEVLISFYLDGLLRPLLALGRADLVWPLLPQIRTALNASSGDKHAMQVQRVTSLLAEQIVPLVHATPDAAAGASAVNEHAAAAQNARETDLALRRFLVELWQADIRKGLWQVIHGIEGSLGLLLVLEGPVALLVIAQTAAVEGRRWTE